MAAGIRVCTLCRLCESRTHAVPGEGPADATLVLLGEAPGRHEDQQGRPFVGMSGRFLDGLLQRTGLDRQRVFITGSVKCRPPANRCPRSDELAICRKAWLAPQIACVRPELIVLMGLTALRQAMGITPAPVPRERPSARIGRSRPSADALLARSLQGLLPDWPAGPVRLDSLHGRLIDTPLGRSFITYHPASAMRFKAPRANMEADFAQLSAIIVRGAS